MTLRNIREFQNVSSPSTQTTKRQEELKGALRALPATEQLMTALA